MSLTDEERRIIVSLEIDKAYRIYNQALVSALLIKDNHSVNSHKGSHALFAQHYVKTNRLPKSYGDLYQRMERLREESDYNCTYDEDPEVLQRNITPAKEMIDTIAEMVKE